MSDTSFEVFENVGYIGGVNALVLTTDSKELFGEADKPTTIGDKRIAPWGENNDMPNIVRDNVEKSEVLSSGMLFNTSVLYGQGIVPKIKRINDGKIVSLEDCPYDEVNQFFEDNDIPGYYLEQCTDIAYFHNGMPETILSNDLKQIVSLRSKEALFSRYGVIPKGGSRIVKHYYSSKWNDSPQESDLFESDVLDPYNPYLDLTTRIGKRNFKEPRFIIPINIPSPGKVYYQRAPWWSVFKSGWFDYSTLIPEFKKALLRNGLAVRYIIYVSDKYWELLFKDEAIDPNDKEACKKRKIEEYDRFKKFISGEKQAGKGMVATKKMQVSGSGAIEEKYITIEVISPEIKGGEFIEDSEEVSNIMSYAMGVHPSLIGSTPGKNKGSFSGTDKRELFLIKSAMMKPYRDRMLRVFNFIKRFNNWPSDLVFVVPEMEFTTLDTNKTGKQQTTPANADQ